MQTSITTFFKRKSPDSKNGDNLLFNALKKRKKDPSAPTASSETNIEIVDDLPSSGIYFSPLLGNQDEDQKMKNESFPKMKKKNRYRLCELLPCEKRASFNLPGEKNGRFCKKHRPSPDMVNVRAKKCEYPLCPRQPGFNFRTEKKPRFCGVHKEPGMLSVYGLCKDPECTVTATFGSPKSKKVEFCERHKKPGMVNVHKQQCEDPTCDVQPCYNFEGEKKGRFCVEHKKDGMVDVTSKRCQYVGGCKKQPTYGMAGSKKAQYCAIHAAKDMVVVLRKMCEFTGCDKQPCYNYKGEKKGRFCVRHREDGMVHVLSRVCEYIEGCDKQPSFNWKTEKKPKFCGDHKEDGMVIVTIKMCEDPGCGVQPRFNFPGEKKGILCSDHKKDGMVNVKDILCDLPGCTSFAHFGPLFQSKKRCHTHRIKGHVLKTHPKCGSSGCNIRPAYTDDGTNYPKRCEKHCLPTDKNVAERKCISCGLMYFLIEGKNLCDYCDPSIIEKVNKAKEKRIRDILMANGLGKYLISDNKKIKGGCSNKIPDFILDFGLFWIILEVDEHQHSNYACECECIRMIQIHQDGGGIPMVFIRYNPDQYICENGEKGKKKSGQRESKLLEVIRNLQNKKEWTHPLSVYYLYYNGHDEKKLPLYGMDYHNFCTYEIEA